VSRRGNLLNSFNWAFRGVVHALRAERNMQGHFVIATIVLVGAIFYSLTRLEIVALLVAISFVLITEMINTAIEETIDLITTSDDPRARVAKDMAAGAVLVAAANALAVAYLVFYDKIAGAPYTVLARVRESPIDLTVVALAIVFVATIAVKALAGRGTALSGGLPSGHAAIAFGLAVSRLAVPPMGGAQAVSPATAWPRFSCTVGNGRVRLSQAVLIFENDWSEVGANQTNITITQATTARVMFRSVLDSANTATPCSFQYARLCAYVLRPNSSNPSNK